MQETIDTLIARGLPGERERLRSALLTDKDGILTTTRRRLARLAQARGIDPHAIDDVVQETLLEAWRHLERLHTPAGFQPWIDEICRNVCRRAAHRRKMELLRHAPLPQFFPDDESAAAAQDAAFLADLPADSDPLEALSRQDAIQLLDHALGLLPQASRQVVELCYLLELPRAEVAARLDISGGALETRLHRARHLLRQLLNGQLRPEAESLGLALDTRPDEGWQDTRLWCPLCARQRLQGCFISFEGEQASSNLHLRCPACAQRYGQDTVHSMGLVSLAGLRSFRPAWKRTMQGLTDLVVQALSQDQHPCLYCGKPSLIQVRDSASAPPTSPYPFWLQLRCAHCGNSMDADGCLPSVDQVVFWSHPLTRRFLQTHPRYLSEPGAALEYDGQSAIRFTISDPESSEHLSVLAHRQSLRVLALC